MNDFVYQLTDLGRERARRLSQHCTYFGAAPVALEDYIASVHAQSLTGQHPTAEDLHRAFEGLLLGDAHARPARAGDQFGPRAVSVRSAGQRQEQHRRADHRRFRAGNLGAPRHRRRRRNPPPLRSHESRGSAARTGRGLARFAQMRQTLGSHPTPDHHRRRRTDHVATRRDHEPRRPASARRRCN